MLPTTLDSLVSGLVSWLWDKEPHIVATISYKTGPHIPEVVPLANTTAELLWGLSWLKGTTFSQPLCSSYILLHWCLDL